MGFSVPRRLRFARCALTAPFHPYHVSCETWRSDFLWHFPSKSLSTFRPRVSPAKPELRGIAPYGVRTFLFRLAPKAILRPAKTSFSLQDKMDLTSDGKSSKFQAPTFREISIIKLLGRKHFINTAFQRGEPRAGQGKTV
jgi:hypothetical protein